MQSPGLQVRANASIRQHGYLFQQAGHELTIGSAIHQWRPQRVVYHRSKRLARGIGNERVRLFEQVVAPGAAFNRLASRRMRAIPRVAGAQQQKQHRQHGKEPHEQTRGACFEHCVLLGFGGNFPSHIILLELHAHSRTFAIRLLSGISHTERRRATQASSPPSSIHPRPYGTSNILPTNSCVHP